MKKRDKRTWETQWQCDADYGGCGNCHFSESSAERCCEGFIYELHVCSWCNNHIDHCKCEVPKDMEG